MKATLLFVSVLALGLLLIPMAALTFDVSPAAAVQTHSPAIIKSSDEQDSDGYYPEEPESEYDEEFEASMAAKALGLDDEADYSPSGGVLAFKYETPGSFKILNESTGEVEQVSARDFVRGAVAAEMPVSFHLEALKAQAVAAHTFALHNHIIQAENPDPGLKGADFRADPQKMRVYITEEIAKDFYGEDGDDYWDKICKAADSVLDYVLVYGEEPIVAAYHAISAGRTEDASNIWSGSAPYLLSVPSESDLNAPGFESTAVFSESDVKSMLESAYPDIALEDDVWFGNATRSDSGYVSEIDVCGISIPGKEIRQIFGLRSHDFEVTYEDGQYIFVVTGYGHGVGLSQYGADFMARQGSTFDEILSAYYTGATLETVG